MQHRIIGLSGKIGSGKDTLADYITKFSDNKFIKKSFALKLKTMGAWLTNTQEELWFTQEGKNVVLPQWDLTVGEFQQKLGVGLRKEIHENIWVLSLFADYTGTSSWIIPDVRFKNEAKAIKEKNGILVRINGDPAKIRASSKRDLNHISETDLDNFANWDLVYNNTGTLKDLEDIAQIIVAKWG